MPFTGRYHLVRNWWLPTQELSPLLVLDRHARSLHPYRGDRAEWEPISEQREAVRKWQRYLQRINAEPTLRHKARLAERLVSRDRDMRRAAAILDYDDLFTLRLFQDEAMGTITTIALDSNYVAGTSGDAIAARYLTVVGGKTLNTVYFHVASYTGTAANVNDIDLEIRAESGTGAATPNTAATVATATKDPASATGWIATTGWSASLSALARYFAIIGDADGNGTDYATVSRSASMFGITGGQYFPTRFLATSTTGGWASGNTVSVASAKIVLGFSDGTSFGDALAVSTAPASDTNRRGLRISSSGLIATLPIFGMLWTAANSNVSGMEIYSTANVPGSSPDNTSTDILYSSTATRIGCLTSGGTPYSLTAAVAHRIVATYGGATTAGPQRMDIGTGEDATLRKAMPGAGEFYYTRANATTDWTNDLVGSIPTVGLLIDGQVAASGGGLLIHGGMVGGLRG